MQPTAWAAALAELRACGEPLLDLTASNPTSCGFEYATGEILAAIAQPGALRYEPDPCGLLSARQAVARYYAEEASAAVDPSQILLSASTSEAYGFLFKLLCDPGDEVLIPAPSYPLFDFLATLENVRLRQYPLFYDHGWHLDPAALEACVTQRTRAIVVVNPNNPTGHFTSPAARRELEAICSRHQLALVVDEVFLDYGVESDAHASFVAGEHPALTFVLSGLSKIAALPQMKCAWMAVFGPPGERTEALARLEIIADTYLSVGAPVQHGLSSLLAARNGIQQQIRDRVRCNLAALDAALVSAPALSRLKVEAGWNAVLRVPAVESSEECAVRLLREQRVVVHPGSFYGFAGEGWIVLSLLPEGEVFAEATVRLSLGFAWSSG